MAIIILLSAHYHINENPNHQKGEYDIWSMRMRQYICHIDHNLWDVIVNGDLEEEPAPTGDQYGPSAPLVPKTTKQLAAKRNQERIKHLALAKPIIPVYKDEMKRSSSSTSTSHNLSFLSFENTSSTNEVSTASGDFRVSTDGGISQVSTTPCTLDVACSFFSQPTTSPQLENEDFQQIDEDDLEELDLRWQVAMLTVRVKKFIQKTGRNLDFKEKRHVSLDKAVGKTNEANIQKPKIVYESVNRDKVIIEDWNSDDEDDVSEVQTVNPVNTNDKIVTLEVKGGFGRPKRNYLDHVSNRQWISSSSRKSEDPSIGTCSGDSDELKFNLFSVSQMCDKKNSVLFTETEYLILSPSFKLLDESQVVLRAPRKDDVYSLDLKNIVPSRGKSPSISFMRPFGFPLTILNTLDSLGKFDGKSDEGYLLGYSTTGKAFRVYNKRTKRVEENLHINFLEDQPNVAGTVPNWMFDLDFLTNSMNYILVSVENQINVDAGTQDSYVAGSSGKDKEPTQEYILLPLHPHWTRIRVEDVAPTAHEKPSKSSPKDNDV
ncbi:hypothetical protein Tco_0448634 [Tanacetum coccineum]